MNGASDKHWVRVSLHFAIDLLAFAVSFLAGMRLRFGGEWLLALETYYPGVILGAFVFACSAYIFGLYSLQGAAHSPFKRSAFLALSFLIAVGFMLGFSYLNFSTRLGRGAMLISGAITYAVVLSHHLLLLHLIKNYRERVALVIASEADESEVRLLNAFARHYLDLAGVIHYDNHRTASSLNVLGVVSQVSEIAQREKLDRVLCTNRCISDPAMCQQFCKLRYSGVTVMPLIGLFEEICQCVPVELITPEWLMSASGLPHMLYIRKLKRGFDIAASLLGLIFFWPFLLLGIVVVKLTSRGPVFYRQVRSGRFGREFTVIKLRTMRVGAEDGQAVWAAARDPRTVPGGNFLRTYRIDEIPQLWNVLRGDMSCVGPRPERPEFVTELTRLIPYYRERLVVQPGITGWAQVNYPYGASVEDAKRKLEYDLYYAKNMSLFLDVFILLDTVRIIVLGGLRKSHLKGRLRYQTDTDWLAATPERSLANPPAIATANR
jgi:exopolysaccharide biosynthesis polyprenyl glycosylphosphotransferase